MTRKIAFILAAALLFWAPALVSAQSTDTAGFDPNPGASAVPEDGANRETRGVDGSQPAGTIGLGAAADPEQVVSLIE